MKIRDGNSSLPVFSHADDLAESTADLWLLIGRILLGLIFVRSGYQKMFLINDIGFEAIAAWFPSVGLPSFLAYIALPFEFFGGLALVFGFATRYVVLGFFIFMLAATFSAHRYWAFPDFDTRRAQDGLFYRNLAMMGGFSFLFVCGAGRLSVDGWLRKLK